ncbi:MAG: pyrrolo-quinoline quinone [Deltaproteobacteria bacterium]|nr:pyrrolo-quinoline quinone [Deltaproteobacteria bacterium]MBI3387721.1 pyrrolo-quinoline quinone [Deltaproteobacteria bacterium]
MHWDANPGRGRFYPRAVNASIALAALLLAPPVGGQVSMLTHHNDNARTGQNLVEAVLTPENVNVADFGRLFRYSVDGAVYAQPLYVPDMLIPEVGARNVVYVATQHDSVYAFDADSADAASVPLWHNSFLDPAAGITTIPNADVGGSPDISPEIGITGTPVIDAMTETLYVVSRTKEPGGYAQRLHALDLATGAEKFGGPVTIAAEIPSTGPDNVGGILSFNPLRENQRAGLLLHDGAVYIAWASHGDAKPFHGWIIGYDAMTLEQVAVFNATPDGKAGGIWQSGAGLSTDADGYLYGATGNGTFDAATDGRDFGDSLLKLNTSGGLQLIDYFTPFNQAALSASDLDFGSTGVLLLPDQPGLHPHLAVAAGKEGTVYLVDRDNLGHFNSSDDSQIVQSLSKILGPTFGMPAYWNGTVYYWAASDVLKAFRLTDGRLSTEPVSQASASSRFPGASPSVSANGSRDAIVWAVQTDAFGRNGPAVLRAYDANDLSIELYNSSQLSGGRDDASPAVKFVSPTIANGRVYVGGNKSVTVFGLRQVLRTPSATTIPTVTTTPTLSPSAAITQTATVRTAMVTPNLSPTPSATIIEMLTATPTHTTTQTGAVMTIAVATATASGSPSPTTTPSPPACPGDCNRDHTVTIDELVIGLNIALGATPINRCPPFACNDDGNVTVDCLLKAINAALHDCAGA